jgi:asparagine synthase (glutamine-hydrolysing)
MSVCGICGLVQIEGPPRALVSQERLGAVTDVMAHRGPSDRGLYLADGVALGVRRLSIVDVEGGHQPFANESGSIWAIQNGELYNHLDLRRMLERDGHRFRSHCDTEILPHLYERFGPSFPTRLRGMFAVCLWDGQKRRCVLARDRLGIKPLYWARAGDTLVFASELKCLLATGLIEPRLDYEAIDAFLTLGFVPGPLTPLAGVSKLMPGHMLVVEDDDLQIERYWRYPEPHVGERLAEDEYRELLLDKLDESVRLRLMSDVPLGAMLSGGLDSSLIVALMARHMSEPVKTFSVGFSEAGSQNELAEARTVAEFLGTDHHELELSFTDDTVDLEELVWCLDEPLEDLSSLGFLALCQLAVRHVTVALSGQGADELFGGYPKHQAASIVGQWQRLPAPVRATGTLVSPLVRGRFQRRARILTARDPVDRLVHMSGRVDRKRRGQLMVGPLAALDGTVAREAVRIRLDGVPDEPLPTTLYLDAQLALVDDMLHYFDRASMAHSLEVRVPFLDHEFVEFCATVPANLKVKRGTTKHILKRAARGLVPDPIIDRPKVGFFAGVVGGWFQAQMERSIKDYVLQPDPRYSEFLDVEAVRNLVATLDRARDKAHSHLLLSILMLEVWLSSFVDRALAAAEPQRERIVVER